jgi:PAS domain S-box-containing protein
LPSPELAYSGDGSNSKLPVEPVSLDPFETAPCGYLVLDMNGAITRANPTFLRMARLVDGLPEGMHFRKLLTSAGAIFYDTQILPALLLSGYKGEVALDLRVDKERIPVLVNFSIERQAGIPAHMLVVLFEARERRQFEKDLLRSRKEAEQLSEVILHSSDAIITVQIDGTVRNWNSGAVTMFGYSSPEAAGKQLSEVIVFDGAAEAFNGAMSPLRDGREFSCEAVSRHKSGSTVDISLKLTPHMEAPGILVAFSAIARDITKQKIAERALLQSEKLASVGRLASSIAHEINNPLAAVTNLLYLIDLQANTPELKQLTETAQDELARMSQITSHTLRFHRQSSKPTNVDLFTLFESVVVLNRARLRNSGIEATIKDCSLTLFCHEGELRQILLNLVSNSIDAMKHGGSLRFRCKQVLGAKTGERGLRITIADTGTGMDQVTLSRSMEPFFTTKGIGGTGLGLWVTQDLVQKNAGSMKVRSSADERLHGTVSTLFFPTRA